VQRSRFRTTIEDSDLDEDVFINVAPRALRTEGMPRRWWPPRPESRQALRKVSNRCLPFGVGQHTDVGLPHSVIIRCLDPSSRECLALRWKNVRIRKARRSWHSSATFRAFSLRQPLDEFQLYTLMRNMSTPFSLADLNGDQYHARTIMLAPDFAEGLFRDLAKDVITHFASEA